MKLIFVMGILHSSVFANELIPANADQKKRIEILSSFFSPTIGETLAIDQGEVRDDPKRDPLLYRGFIQVTPPKNHCLNIRHRHFKSDTHVCRPKKVPFELREIDTDGSLTWKITTSEKDPGTIVQWKTPYRLAQYIPAGSIRETFGIKIPIEKCEVIINQFNQRIILNIVGGQKWTIRFPKRDQLVNPEAEPPPNLFVIKGRKKKPLIGSYQIGSEPGAGGEGDPDGEIAESEPPSAEEQEIEKKLDAEIDEQMEDEPEVKGPAAPQAPSWVAKIRGQHKKKKINPYKFNLKEYQINTMHSDHFSATSSSGGLNGECRYKFWGAPDDVHSGIIECFNTDTYDAVEAPLSCARPLLLDRLRKGVKIRLPDEVRNTLPKDLQSKLAPNTAAQ